MLADTQAPVLLSQKRLVASLPAHRAQVVTVDADWELIAHNDNENLTSSTTIDNCAYILYTSGSTGRPKGVVIEHRSTVALLAWAGELFGSDHLAGVLASTSLCFDLSVFELFAPLSWGGKVILAENLLQLPALPAAREITLLNTVPSVMTEFLRIGEIPCSVRTINLAGEPLHNPLAQQLYQQGTIQQVYNLYGPSEGTTYATCALGVCPRISTSGMLISLQHAVRASRRPCLRHAHSPWQAQEGVREKVRPPRPS
jgi:non-ribosomal peptide synthetase component F